jgi:hypothetical protein
MMILAIAQKDCDLSIEYSNTMYSFNYDVFCATLEKSVSMCTLKSMFEYIPFDIHATSLKYALALSVVVMILLNLLSDERRAK